MKYDGCSLSRKDMHSAIWAWIRGWCEDFYRAPLVLPNAPADVLKWLIWKIGNCGGDTDDSRHILSWLTVEKKTGVGGICSSSQHKMCEVGQRLFDEGLQEKDVMEKHEDDP